MSLGLLQLFPCFKVDQFVGKADIELKANRKKYDHILFWDLNTTIGFSLTNLFIMEELMNFCVFVGFSFFLKEFIYLLLERVGMREKRKGEKHWLVTSCKPPAGDLAFNPGMCPAWELNRQP